MSYIISLMTILFIFSCNKEAATIEDCENWSMLSFQGKPFEAKRLKTECHSHKLKYTHDVCQKAFQDLVLKGDLELVKDRFGDKISGCFTSDDIKRFHKVSK